MGTRQKKVLIVNERFGSWSSYHSPFVRFGDFTSNERILDYEPQNVSCVVFTGGADVNPKYYGQRPCRETHWSDHRDDFEIEVFRKVRRLGLPIFGICRGAQLMCVMAGGTLCQHLTDHGYYDHYVTTHDGRSVLVNSYHHQMMLPPSNAEVLAWVEPKISKYYLGNEGRGIHVDREIEVCHFPNINALAVQYHPELLGESDEGWCYYQELIDEFIYGAQALRRKDKSATMLRRPA